MNYTIDELLEQYRDCQRQLGGSPFGEKRAKALEGMFSALGAMKSFPFPVSAGDRVWLKSEGCEGTVVYADNEFAVVRHDNCITFEAFNGYQARTRLERI